MYAYAHSNQIQELFIKYKLGASNTLERNNKNLRPFNSNLIDYHSMLKLVYTLKLIKWSSILDAREPYL